MLEEKIQEKVIYDSKTEDANSFYRPNYFLDYLTGTLKARSVHPAATYCGWYHKDFHYHQTTIDVCYDDEDTTVRVLGTPDAVRAVQKTLETAAAAYQQEQKVRARNERRRDLYSERKRKARGIVGQLE